MSTLYELSAAYRELAERLEAAELPEEVAADTLDAESGDLDEKIISYGKIISNLRASSAARIAATEPMIKESEKEDKKANWLESRLLETMIATGRTKVPSPWFTVSVKTNTPSTIIDDEAAIPKDYLREIPAKEASTAPDKTLIKKAIQDGFTVPGAHLESTKTVSIK